MAGLGQFLTQIGAAELSSAVTVPTTQDGLGPMGRLLNRVQQEIDAVNDQTRALLLAEWPEFTRQVQNGQALLTEIDHEENELVDLEGLMEGENAILPPLVSALKSHAALSTSHANSSAELVLYTSLLTHHQHIKTLASLTTTGALPQAVSALASLLSHQHNHALEPWVAATPAARALDRWALDERARLEAAIITSVEACFEVQPGKEDRREGEPQATLRLRSAVSAAPGARELGVTEVLEALEGAYKLPATDSTLTKNRTVEYHLARVAKQLIKHFVTPFLAAAGSAESDVQPLSFGYATAPDSPNEQIALLVPEAPHQPPLATLSAFLTFVGSHSSLIPSPWAASFTKHFTPALQSLVVDSFLAPSLPKAIADLPPYLTVLVAASGFEGEFLQRGGWFSFFPAPLPGQLPREEATVIKSWMSRVDKHWAKRVGDLALSSVREVVQTNDWQGESVETEVVEVISAPPPPPPAPKEPTPPPPPPPTISVPPPQARTVSPAVRGRNFSPSGAVSPTLAPSPAVTPAPRPGKLGTRIGSPATAIPIKPAPSGSSIPIKPKAASVPIPVRVRTTTSSPSQSHFPRESVAKVAENGLVTAGIAKVIENARAASPSPPTRSPVEAAVDSFPSAPAQQAPPILSPVPIVAAPSARRISVTSPPPAPSPPGVSRSPSIGKKRRGSIVSHAPVTHVEPSADEPEWNMALSPVIDPVAELGWGSGAGFFDMLNAPAVLEPVVEQEAAVDEPSQAEPTAFEPAAKASDTAAVQDEGEAEGEVEENGWDLDDEEAGVVEPNVTESEPTPLPTEAQVDEAQPAFDYTPSAAEPGESPEPELLLDNASVAHARELDLDALPTTSDTTESTQPTSPSSITTLLPEVNVTAAAAAVAGVATAVGVSAVETASHFFSPANHQHDDVEAGETGDDDGWGIEGGEEVTDDADTSWRYEPPPPMAPTPEPPAQDEEEEASGWQYSPPKPVEPSHQRVVSVDEESGWGYEPAPVDEEDPEAGHEVDEEGWGYEPQARTQNKERAVEAGPESSAEMSAEPTAAEDSPVDHQQDTSDYTPLDDDVASREHTFEPRDGDEFDAEAGEPVIATDEGADPWALEEAGQIEPEVEPEREAAAADETVEEPVEPKTTPPSPQVKRTISAVDLAEAQPNYKPFSSDIPEEDRHEADRTTDRAVSDEVDNVEPTDDQLPQPATADDPIAPQHVEEPLVDEPEAEVEPTGWGLPRSEAVAEHDLLSAHDYLTSVEVATPMPSETPEEFIIPGEGLAAVPTMLVPELFESQSRRASYEPYESEQVAEEQLAEQADDGWDLEGVEHVEDQVEAEQAAPEPFGEPPVEDEAGMVEHEQVTVESAPASFEVVVEPTPPELEEKSIAAQSISVDQSEQPDIEEADQVDLVQEARKHSPAPIDTTPPTVTISIQPPSPASTTGADVPIEYHPDLPPTLEAAEAGEDDFTWDEDEEARLIREVEEAERELAEIHAEAQAKAEQRAERRASMLPQPGVDDTAEANEEEEGWDAEEEARLLREVEEAERALEEAEAELARAYDRGGTPGTPAPERAGFQAAVAEPIVEAEAAAEGEVASVEVGENPESERELAPDVEEAEEVPALEDFAVGAETHHPEPEIEIAIEPLVAEPQLTDDELAGAAPTEVEVESAEQSEDEAGNGWDLGEDDHVQEELASSTEAVALPVPAHHAPVDVEESRVEAVKEDEPLPAPVPEAEVSTFDAGSSTTVELDETDAWDLEQPEVAQPEPEPAVESPIERPVSPVATFLETLPLTPAATIDERVVRRDELADTQAGEDDGWGLEGEESEHGPEEEAAAFAGKVDFPAVQTELALGIAETELAEVAPAIEELPDQVVSQVAVEPDLAAEDEGWGIEHADSPSQEPLPTPVGQVEEHHSLASQTTVVHQPLYMSTYEPQQDSEPEPEVDNDGWDLDQDDAEPEEAEAATLDQVPTIHDQVTAEPELGVAPAPVEKELDPAPEVENEDDGWGIEEDDGVGDANPEEGFMSSPEVITKADSYSPPHTQPSFTPQPHWAAPTTTSSAVPPPVPKEAPTSPPPVASYVPAAAAGVSHPTPLAIKTESTLSVEPDDNLPGTSAGTDEGDGWGFSPGTSPAEYEDYVPPTPMAPVPESTRAPAPPPPAVAQVKHVPPPPSASKALPPRVSAPVSAPAPAAPADDGWGFDDGLELDLDLGEPQEDVYEDMDAPVTPQISAPPTREKMTTHPRAPPSLTSSVSNQSYISNVSAANYGFNQDHVRTATPPNRGHVLSPVYSHRSYGSNASASYAFSPPSSSQALSPPPPESEEEVEEAEDAWGFDDDSLDVEEDEPEAMRLRGGASTPDQGVDEGAWELKRNSLPLKEGQKLRRRKETMLISTSSRELIKVAEEVLVQALAVGEAGFPYPTFAAASGPLFETFISLFALYRATAPVQHAQLLETVPALGMQFANDALWLADELDRVWDRLGGQYRPDLQHQTEAVNDTVKKMKRMGKDHRARQVEIQRQALMDLLDETKGFLYTADQARFEGCERALQQVVHSLTRLAGAWKAVLNPAVLWSTVGGLINDVLVRVLEEIEGQSDISEEESGKLNTLCKMLHDLDQLFEGTNTSIGREVPTYFKFVFLSELLEASMADVLFLFDNGHLVDFSPEEIARLVRALFADSPLRARNLEHIARGHPEGAGLGAIGEEEEEGWGV